MFCIHCGTQVPEGGNFCVGCGSPVKPAVAATPPPTPHRSAPPAPAPRVASAKCSWCGSVVNAAESACPRCGASVSLAGAVAASGWAQLPARKDMAKLQFGNSFCQVEGLYVPVADMNLAAEDGIYFTHHVLLWKDPQINITTMPLAGGWKRLFAGMPLIMTQARGPGHIAFSRDLPGELIPLPLQPGQAVDGTEAFQDRGGRRAGRQLLVVSAAAFEEHQHVPVARAGNVLGLAMKACPLKRPNFRDHTGCRALESDGQRKAGGVMPGLGGQARIAAHARIVPVVAESGEVFA